MSAPAGGPGPQRPRTRRLGETAPEPAAPAARALVAGERAGPYTIVELLAEGGFGTVARARPARGPDVAVKVLHGELCATDDAVRRFEREIAVLATIDHPGIVRVLDHGRLADGRPYFAMELLHGADLATRLAAGPLPATAVAATVTALAAALDAAHARGVIHRDVKASNVFICDDGRVCLLDFGIAKLDSGHSLTRSRQALGTPSAMAPEQLASAAVDARTDVYALGALAYHMLTGRPPFAGEPATIIQHLHRYAERPRPSAEVPLAPAIDTVIVRAMSVSPEDRYPTAPAMADALAQAVSPPARETVAAEAIKVSIEPPAGAAEAALDRAEAAFDLVAGPLADAGFAPALETSFATLYARPLAAGPDADTLVASLRARAAKARLDLRLTLGRGEAEARGGAIVGGPLVETLWADPGDVARYPGDDG